MLFLISLKKFLDFALFNFLYDGVGSDVSIYFRSRGSVFFRISVGVFLYVQCLTCSLSCMLNVLHAQYLARHKGTISYHSIFSMDSGFGFVSILLTFPFLIRITRSAIGTIAVLCVMTMTVIPFCLQVSCKSLRMDLPVT